MYNFVSFIKMTIFQQLFNPFLFNCFTDNIIPFLFSNSILTRIFTSYILLSPRTSLVPRSSFFAGREITARVLHEPQIPNSKEEYNSLVISGIETRVEEEREEGALLRRFSLRREFRWKRSLPAPCPWNA